MALVVDDGRDGGVVLYCHAGCTWRDILRALKVTPSALTVAPPTPPARHAGTVLRGVKFPPPKVQGDGGTREQRGFRFESEHAYGEPTPVAWKIRHRHPSGAKEITWESLNPKGERVPGLLGRREVELGMYRAREIRMAMAADETVVLCESESSVDALMRAGIYATCWPGGAGTAPVEQIRELFNGYRRVVLIPDNDGAGIAVGKRITDAGITPYVVIGGEGEDAKDLLARLGLVEFRRFVEGVLSR